jgi:hypothetical protein
MLSRRVLGVARYRLTATWASAWTGYLTVVVLVALLGGLAMGAVAGARRTQSSYPVFLASTHPTAIQIITAVDNPAIGNGKGYNPVLNHELAELPGVQGVATATGLNIEPLKPDGAPINIPYLPISQGNAQGNLGGEGFRVDQLAVISGRAPNPARVNEFATLPSAAAAYGFHLGETIAMGIYTNAQTEQADFGSPRLKPYRRIDVKLVGLVLPATSLVEDDVDLESGLGYFTPALTRQLLGCCVNFSGTGLIVATGEVNRVRAEAAKVVPKGLPITVTSVVSAGVAKAERAIKPESIALGVFGGIAGLAALLIVSQIIGRQLRRQASDAQVLRALGASPALVTTDGLLGLLGAVALGSVVAVFVAVALSPIAPLGPVRPVYPTPGIAFDWTVLGLGFAALVFLLSVVAVALSVRAAPHRVARRVWAPRERAPRLGRLIARLNLSPPMATGVRFALEPGSGANTVPVRSAIFGTALAVIALITTVTFGASLNTLVSTPRLYGWNWDFALASDGGDIPEAHATALLSHDPYVASFSGAYFANLPIDGQTVPILGTSPGAAVQPPILAGHRLEGRGQVVLGPITLATLHKKLGDTVTISSVGFGAKTAGSSTRLRIVGVATMPAIGLSGEDHLEMGTGAVISYQLIPPVLRNPFNDPIPGPNSYFIDLRPGADPAAAARSLQKMTGPLTNTANFGVVLQRVERPAEIVNYRSIGTTPAILGAALGGGALAALGLTLFASVRRRQRSLALVKTLGFTRRQVAATVAWQSNVAVALGVIVGVPLGIVVGRALWDLFVHAIHAVPLPVVPVTEVVFIALGALVLANVISLLPGRIAARTPVAVLLRAE